MYHMTFAFVSIQNWSNSLLQDIASFISVNELVPQVGFDIRELVISLNSLYTDWPLLTWIFCKLVVLIIHCSWQPVHTHSSMCCSHMPSSCALLLIVFQIHVGDGYLVCRLIIYCAPSSCISHWAVWCEYVVQVSLPFTASPSYSFTAASL